MRMRPRFFGLFVGLALLLSSFANAQEETTAEGATEAKAAESVADDDEEPVSEGFKVRAVEADGEIELAGEAIEYTVTTGTLDQTDDAGASQAKVFFVAYTRKGTDHGKRPVTFAFNGGPGSSSVWLHLGMLGPKRIELPDDATPLKPPYKLTKNPHCLLSVTDLVFIDPVSTGYSRPVDQEKKSQFHGYREDVRSVSQFIHDYLSQAGRWESPKFLLGESYGGIRAAGVSDYLRGRYNLELNGVVVISGAINFKTLRFGSNNDTPFICFLPTYASTAWYHGQLSDELQALPVDEVAERAAEFALKRYAPVLLKGSSASEEEQQSVAKRYGELTGLDPDFVLRCNLRVTQPRFSKELLRDEGQTVGRFDSRYRGIDRDSAGERTEYDPSGAAIFGPFTATMNYYLREELGYQQPRTYEILTGKVQPWNYDSFTGRYVDASDELRSAMTGNPYLKLFVAAGYYDLATPHYAMDYTLDHLGLVRSQQENVTIRYYEGGHMMYIHEPSMQKLHDDLVKWYQDADNVE